MIAISIHAALFRDCWCFLHVSGVLGPSTREYGTCRTVSVLVPFCAEGGELLVRPGSFGFCGDTCAHFITGEPRSTPVVKLHIPFEFALVLLGGLIHAGAPGGAKRNLAGHWHSEAIVGIGFDDIATCPSTGATTDG